MAMRDNDTDPSTPQAMRPAERSAGGDDSTGPTPRPKLSTDPGVGPPSLVASPGRAIRIDVPPPTTRSAAGPAPPLAQSKKDSVELLLEGMTGPRPDRTRTTPQSDGQAAAAYHARHGVRAARTEQEREPKVLVERWSLSAILRDVRPGALSATEPTPRMVVRGLLARRVVTATLAGLIVVLALFVVLRMTSATPSSNEPAATVPEPVATAAAVQASASAAPVEATAEGPPSVATPAPPESATPASRPRRRVPRAAPASPGGNLGEFKTTF
jgi:hypothetical protein